MITTSARTRAFLATSLVSACVLSAAGAAPAQAGAGSVATATTVTYPANVGTMPKGFSFDKEMKTANEKSAIDLCQGAKTDYIGFTGRKASRFAQWVSESYESGEEHGAIVMKTEAGAKSFMKQFRAVATDCVKNPKTKDGLTVKSRIRNLKGTWDESVATGTQFTGGEFPYGTVTVIARKGRNIVAVQNWILYAEPYASNGDFNALFDRPAVMRLLTKLG